MKANELRIGNWYKGSIDFPEGSISAKINFNKEKEFQLTRHALKVISQSYNNGSGSFDLIGFIEPIPLTEIWLLRFGFKRFCKDWAKNGIIIHNRKRGFVLRKSVPDIKHVHQLQNLYFALTGAELPLNTLENE